MRLLHETLRQTAAHYPTQTAIVAGTARLTYDDLWQQSLRLAQALRDKDVQRGDRVVIFLENDWPCAVALYGTLLADAVFVIVNPQTKADKLAYILNDCAARILVTSNELRHCVHTALAATPQVQHILVTDLSADEGLDPRACHFQNLLAATLPPSGDAPVSRAISRDLCALIYTSGSTGQPKGVMHTHQSMLFALGSLVEYLGITAADHIMCVLPLAFDYGLYQLLMAVQCGATLVLERSFAYPAQIFKVMAAENVTIFPGVPTVFAMLLAAHERQSLSFPTIRCVTNTAAALPADFNTRLRTVFPHAAIYRMYGLTECKRVSYLPPADIDRKPDSVGIAIPGTEVLVLDAQGQPVPPGVPGTLHVRGTHVMAGYWNQPEKTAHMLKPGPTPGELMLCTHDMFTQDADGYLTFIGRSDDIIKSRGEKVSPLEVEAVIHIIPGVHEVAVLGAPDALLGEAVCAFISVNTGSTLAEAQIKRFCGQHLEGFMVPSRVIILSALPKSANGKIDKQTLAILLSA